MNPSNGAIKRAIIYNGYRYSVAKQPDDTWIIKQPNVGWRVPSAEEQAIIDAGAFAPLRDERGTPLPRKVG